MNNYIAKIQQILTDYNSTINVKVGSALYFLVILPAAFIYQYVDELITNLKKESCINTATDKTLLLENFGIPPISGSKGTGEIQIVVSPTQPAYYFPVGSIFENSSGDQVSSTSNISILTSEKTSAIIPVQTVINTAKIYYVGEIFSSLNFGSLVINCYVSKQIGGGSTDEAIGDWEQRIYNNLTQTTVTRIGVFNKIKTQFPTVLDININNNNVYIKAPLEEKEATTNILHDNIAKITYISEGMSPYVTYNKGTTYEYTIFATSGLVKYLRPTLIKEIQSYVNDSNIFPIGFKLNIIHANPVFISGVIEGIGNIDVINNYIVTKKIESFMMSQFLVACNITNYKLPIKLDFWNQYTLETTEVINKYDFEFSAYYNDNLRILNNV